MTIMPSTFQSFDSNELDGRANIFLVEKIGRQARPDIHRASLDFVLSLDPDSKRKVV